MDLEREGPGLTQYSSTCPGSHCIDHASLKLMEISPTLAPKSWDYKHVPPDLAQNLLFMS